MPIPFISPIAGILLAGGGATMIARYIQADDAQRSRLDAWLTDIIKSAARVYLKTRHGVDLGSLNADEQEAYWREFGLRLKDFLEIAEPIAMNLYARSFVDLNPSEQAEVIRRIASDTQTNKYRSCTLKRSTATGITTNRRRRRAGSI